MQDKGSICRQGGSLVQTDHDGEFILKPAPLALSGGLELVGDAPANEHLVMQAAAQACGIQTAPCGLVFFPDGQPAYIVRRFDRKPENTGKWSQEDFCQLAGRTRATHGENYKYDSSYEELGQLLRRYCPSWKIESEKLFRLIVFNYAFGNGDAHLKNFSLLETAFGDFALSPAYDLLCTAVHLPFETRTALDLFADFSTPSFEANAFAKRVDFLELGLRFGLSPSRAERILGAILAGSDAAEALARRSLLSPEALRRFLAVIADRRRALAD